MCKIIKLYTQDHGSNQV